MASMRGPEFEPAFGSRATERPLEPRLRDRSGFPSLDGHSGEEPRPGSDSPERNDDESGGSISELFDTVDSHRTVGEAAESAPTAPDAVAGEPMLVSSTPARNPGRGPVIPAELLDAQTRSGAGPRDASPSNATVNPTRVGTRWSRLRRGAMVACAIAVLLGLVYFLVSLFQVWTTGRTHDDGPVDAIVVMGAAQYDGRPSPQLAARLDHVVEIWPNVVAPLVVVTGGNIPGDRFTEAEASASYLIERGIPADAILQENSGSNSQESLTSVGVLLGERGLDDVLIVTDPYHALRSRLIAEEVGLDAQVSSTDTSVVTGFESFTRHVKEAGGVAVGRVIGFRRLSDLVD